jgi:hypothetical protein
VTAPSDDDITTVPGLPALAAYLQGAGWTLEDEDARTSQWRPQFMAEDLRIVLPSRQEVRDYAIRVHEALRTLAYAERRLPQEITEDISFGGADNVSVRLTPDAPPGQAPLSLAHSVVSALRSFVIASAAALEVHSLVLPARRPNRAESYASKVRLSAHPGSFVLTLALPLLETHGDDEADDVATDGQNVMFQMPPQPFGRQVTNRMLAAAQHAQGLAEEVGTGREQLRAFGQLGRAEATANATELAALQGLGGPEYDLYQLRFAQSPLAPERQESVSLQITPSQQRILGEAAEFLRTRQPRAGVTAQGLVVRLYRQSKLGPGEVVIEGFDDDSGTTRRYRVQLTEDDYNDAVRAHRNGLQVAATGDLEIRGTHLWLRRLTSFSVIPGLEYDD